ncbi:unnamed protein product [Caenorhabditis auriculariae]|uniref:Hexosyltransferase n=1 Tax=Caenorhabditis auriculariae TaxID=2777116 RepID=A0A8S1H9D9_9PELO|nr:unnamed protein product [Caenorhabditis auriculariae]
MVALGMAQRVAIGDVWKAETSDGKGPIAIAEDTVNFDPLLAALSIDPDGPNFFTRVPHMNSVKKRRTLWLLLLSNLLVILLMAIFLFRPTGIPFEHGKEVLTPSYPLSNRRGAIKTKFVREILAPTDDSDQNDMAPNTMFEIFSHPGKQEGVEMLLIISSTSSDPSTRQAIRRSWANISELDDPRIHVEFALGRPSTAETTHRLEAEQADHEDLIVIDIDELDGNIGSMTTYTALEYKWLKYPKARCLLKTGTNSVLHLPNLMKLCMETEKSQIIGRCDSVPLRSKNSTNSNLTDPHEKLPQFCYTGTYLIVGQDIPETLFDFSRKQPFIRLHSFQ